MIRKSLEIWGECISHCSGFSEGFVSSGDVQCFVDAGLIEIDLVLAPARSRSTSVCCALATIGGYDLYLHEPFRLALKRDLNPKDTKIAGQSARNYNPYRHILEFCDTARRKGMEPPFKILIKEMIAPERYRQNVQFPFLCSDWLFYGLMPAVRCTILLTRDVEERRSSLQKVSSFDPMDDTFDLIQREEDIATRIQVQYPHIQQFDTSSSSPLFSDPDIFFQDILMTLGRERVSGARIDEFSYSAIDRELILLDPWAKKDFLAHRGFVQKTVPVVACNSLSTSFLDL